MKAINRTTCDNCYYIHTCIKEMKNINAEDNDKNPARGCDGFKQVGIKCGNVMVNGMGHQWIE